MIRQLIDTTAVAHSLNCKNIIITTGNEIAGGEKLGNHRPAGGAQTEGHEQSDGRRGAAPLPGATEPPCRNHGKHYWLTTMAQAGDIVEEVDSPGLSILYDLYHQQITEGNLIDRLHRHIHQIGHIHPRAYPVATNWWAARTTTPPCFQGHRRQ